MARFSLDDVELPIVQAPMAGGPSTPALAGAVAEAGALAFLASAYVPVEKVRSDIAELRVLTDRPFGVNIFVPSDPSSDRGALERYAAEVAADAERYGVRLGEPAYADDGYEAKLDLLVTERVPLVSFTFGSPPREAVDRLHDAGAAVWATVTSVAEARIAQGAGADGLVVQGVEAGGHRGTFDAAPGDIGLLALLQLVRAEVDLPLIATGGIVTGEGVAAVLAAGARAAQIGTALMLAPEAGTLPVHRRAFDGGEPTALTRAFSGRSGRGIVNRFMRDHPDAPEAFPEVTAMVNPVRAAARQAGDPDAINLWAGQAYPLARSIPAAEVVRSLAAEAREALAAAAKNFGP
jgi:nitronate monooxygenase